MVGAVHQHAPILSVASFRTWLTSRPEEEHWELIEGVPMMMAPPNRRHQRIVSSLESLLNDALKRHDPTLVAYHDIGVNIVSTVPYDPEPDVGPVSFSAFFADECATCHERWRAPPSGGSGSRPADCPD